MIDKSKNAIVVVTSVALIYVTATTLPLPFGVIFFLFLFATAGLLWMVYTILKDTANLSGKTFDDTFYEDIDPNEHA